MVHGVEISHQNRSIFLRTMQHSFLACQVVQSLEGTSWYVATTSQRRRSHLGTSGDSLRRVKLVSLS